LVIRLEENLKSQIGVNEKSITQLKEYFTERMTLIQAKNDLHNDGLYGRVVRLEEHEESETAKERDELVMWRQRAMGLTDSSHQHSPLSPLQVPDAK